MKKHKFITGILAGSLIITSISPFISQEVSAKRINGRTQHSSTQSNIYTDTIDLSKIDIENELLKTQELLKEGKITNNEFELIKSILKPEQLSNQITFRSYYPSRKVAYINNWGIKKIYNEGLRKSNGWSALVTFTIGLASGPYGWGLGALGVLQAFSGYSAFEKAVQQAYWQGKGIDVYYQIHKGVMSLNKVSYVVI